MSITITLLSQIQKNLRSHRKNQILKQKEGRFVLYCIAFVLCFHFSWELNAVSLVLFNSKLFSKNSPILTYQIFFCFYFSVPDLVKKKESRKEEEKKEIIKPFTLGFYILYLKKTNTMRVWLKKYIYRSV